ncbi:MAG: alpha/beta fold hydrolase [Ardenticatenia bacterium]|nr:alpha/beta fold hydrolase [Ardenticatenia bacterium]
MPLRVTCRLAAIAIAARCRRLLRLPTLAPRAVGVVAVVALEHLALVRNLATKRATIAPRWRHLGGHRRRRRLPWRRDLGYAQVNVFGHSWGAMLALIHAAAHPDAVARQVLVGVGRTEAPLCGGRRRSRRRRGQQVRC